MQPCMRARRAASAEHRDRLSGCAHFASERFDVTYSRSTKEAPTNAVGHVSQRFCVLDAGSLWAGPCGTIFITQIKPAPLAVAAAPAAAAAGGAGSRVACSGTVRRIETIYHESESQFLEVLSELCDAALAVTLGLATGRLVAAVLGFHDGHTLVYEHWDAARGAPSGDFATMALDDITHVVIF